MFAKVQVTVDQACDAALLLRSAEELGGYPVTVLHSLRQWAAACRITRWSPSGGRNIEGQHEAAAHPAASRRCASAAWSAGSTSATRRVSTPASTRAANSPIRPRLVQVLADEHQVDGDVPVRLPVLAGPCANRADREQLAAVADRADDRGAEQRGVDDGVHATGVQLPDGRGHRATARDDMTGTERLDQRHVVRLGVADHPRGRGAVPSWIAYCPTMPAGTRSPASTAPRAGRACPARCGPSCRSWAASPRRSATTRRAPSRAGPRRPPGTRLARRRRPRTGRPRPSPGRRRARCLSGRPPR